MKLNISTDNLNLPKLNILNIYYIAEILFINTKFILYLKLLMNLKLNKWEGYISKKWNIQDNNYLIKLLILKHFRI